MDGESPVTKRITREPIQSRLNRKLPVTVGIFAGEGASAAVVVDGQLIAYITEKSVSGKTRGFPLKALQAAMKAASVLPGDVDRVGIVSPDQRAASTYRVDEFGSLDRSIKTSETRSGRAAPRSSRRGLMAGVGSLVKRTFVAISPTTLRRNRLRYQIEKGLESVGLQSKVFREIDRDLSDLFVAARRSGHIRCVACAVVALDSGLSVLRLGQSDARRFEMLSERFALPADHSASVLVKVLGEALGNKAAGQPVALAGDALSRMDRSELLKHLGSVDVYLEPEAVSGCAAGAAWIMYDAWCQEGWSNWKAHDTSRPLCTPAKPSERLINAVLSEVAATSA